MATYIRYLGLRQIGGDFLSDKQYFLSVHFFGKIKSTTKVVKKRLNGAFIFRMNLKRNVFVAEETVLCSSYFVALQSIFGT